MKTIGLIGGMSWESSLEYYRLINETIRDRLGGFHSAKCLLYSVDFHETHHHQINGQWDAAGEHLAHAAQSLERGGADCLVLCTNTMHKVADHITEAVDIPFLHIADTTGMAIQQADIQTIGLLGTRYTMEQDFYRKRLEDVFKLNVLVPNQADRDQVHDVIFDELVHGVIQDTSRARYQAVIQRLTADGAEGVILGCTEIGLLIKEQHSPVPVFDTTLLHAQGAVEWALQST